MSSSGPLSTRTLIFCPIGRDSHIASNLLGEAMLPSFIVNDLDSLCAELERGAGLALIANEAIKTSDTRPLVSFLNSQLPWSDFPFVLLTERGGGPERNPSAARIADLLGNVAFLERPFHPTTLISVIKSALRGRLRQYEARARQAELGEGEKRLQTALVAGNLGSWTLNIENMELVASDKCKAHFGRTHENAFSYPDLIEAIHPDDRARMMNAVTETLESGTDYVIEYRNVWLDQSVHWVDVRARAIQNEAGEVKQLVGVSSDITSRKLAEIERDRLLERLDKERAALSELTQELENRVNDRTAELFSEVAAREKAQEQLIQSQKLESIGKLTGGIAHDFNNLLAAVIGNLDLLTKRIPNEPRVQRLINGAMQGAQRGVSLTQRMLAFARQQDLKTSSVDVTLLLVGLTDLIERSLGQRYQLEVRTLSDIPPAQIDANQVELAILNLAINARDAMPEGGTIKVEARVEESKTQKSAKCIVISVVDHGTGMDEFTLQKAAEPFFSTKPLGKGTGLGLSMVHGLAVQLGGHLDLKSTIGQGTTAELWLPAAHLPAKIQEEETQVSAPNRQATILVVDDDVLISMSTVDMLEDLGHTVIEANSGMRALEIIKTDDDTIDLIITDQIMPGMTGLQLAESVKLLRPALPILLATGYTDLPEGLRTDLPRLSKPYRQSQLKEQIDRLL